MGALQGADFGISVIIPVSGRAGLLTNLLRSLRAADEPGCGVEVLVMDNTEDSAQSDEIAGACAELGARHCRAPKGPSASRNAGVAEARFEVVCFVDSDCEVGQAFLTECAAFFSDANVAACAGVTAFTGPGGWLWRFIEEMPFAIPFAWAGWKRRTTWSPCSNIAFRREAFSSAGGFQAILPPREAGEDVDFGIRFTAAGHTILCNPRSIVYHARGTWNSLGAFVERCFRFGRGEARLMGLHPTNTITVLPNLFQCVLLLSISSIVLCALERRYSILSVPFVWTLAVVVAQAAILRRGRFHRRPSGSVPSAIGATVFQVVYDMGLTWELLRARHESFALRRFIFTEEYYVGEWLSNTLKFHSYLFGFLIAIVLAAFA